LIIPSSKAADAAIEMAGYEPELWIVIPGRITAVPINEMVSTNHSIRKR
jgi:hypothetical protein